MATRTIRDYNLTFLNDFAKVGSYEEIALNGLGADEIGEIIVQAFQSGVKRVSPEIVRVFQVYKIGWIMKNWHSLFESYRKEQEATRFS